METHAMPAVGQAVEVSESIVSIPTYGPLGRDPWPNVFFKSQWFAPFYPLDRYVHPAGPRHEQSYVAVTLENEYLRVVVLPQLGGHVWQMFDKVCNEHLVYNNDVIKPTQIGFRKGWCAIGIEFNFPVAHSLQSIDPLPYRVVRHEDGAASVLTWHRDRPRRIEMVLHLTLKPGRRDLRVRAEMYNPSAVRRPYDYWTNTAISARPETQFIFPTKWMQSHGGRKMYEWPIVNGQDMRFQTNYQKTVSFFAWDPEPPFFGCWWSDTDNGLVHVADPAKCRGKKLFNWGKRAQAWLVAVTDESGPYAELQAGRFATQADYQWLEPGQHDVLEEAWYGYAKLGGLSWAGDDLAMHVRHDGTAEQPARRATIALHAVCDIPGATATVQSDNVTVCAREIDLSAAQPVQFDVDLPAARQSVTVEVHDPAGRVVGQYTASLQPLPRGRMPRAPQEKWQNMFATLEQRSAPQRACIGEVAELNNLWLRATEAYQSALQADPNCAQALSGLGLMSIRNAKYAEAAEYARRLIATGTRTSRPIGHYLLGAAELLDGRCDAAALNLRKAASNPKVGAMAQLYLAMAQAKLGKTADALRAIERIGEPLASMPIARWVKAALRGDPAASDPAAGWTVCDPSELFDVAGERAIWSIRMGLPATGEQIVTNLLKQRPALQSEPLVWYLKAYLQHLQGRQDEATASLGRAQQMERTARMPGLPEWTEVLGWAIQTNPADAKAHACLAPLQYWLTRRDEAIEHWRKALAGNGDADSCIRYGLAMGLWEARNDRSQAAKILAEAIAGQPGNERLYLVLDDVLIEAQDNAARGEWLARARQNCGQTDAIVERTCNWLVNQQRWAEAAGLLNEHKFGASHGLYTRRRLWLLAYHQLALECLRAGDNAKACEYGLTGSKPPATLGEDDMTMPFCAPVLLAAAEACERMGQKAKAKDLCREVVALYQSGHVHPPYTEIYRARVLLKLGQKKAAEKVLQDVLRAVLPQLEGSRPGLNTGHFHYLYGLVLETQGQQAEAEKQFARAAELKMAWANLVGYGIQWGFN